MGLTVTWPPQHNEELEQPKIALMHHIILCVFMSI